MDTLNGKGIMIWQISYLAGGNQDEAVADLLAMGIKRVSIKVAQKQYKYAYNPDNVLIPFLEKCFNAGLKVYGWQWVELDNPGGEAARAIERVTSLGLDGWEIDAEGRTKGKYSQASIYIHDLKNGLPDTPVGLCSYRFPSYHQTVPWDQFLSLCDYHCPQVYWNPPYPPNYGPVPETQRSYSELMVEKLLPFVPVGRAYIGDGHAYPTGQELTDFMYTAYDLDSPGVSFWSFDALYAHSGGAERAEAIGAYNWVTEPTLEERVTALEAIAHIHT